MTVESSLSSIKTCLWLDLWLNTFFLVFFFTIVIIRMYQISTPVNVAADDGEVEEETTVEEEEEKEECPFKYTPLGFKWRRMTDGIDDPETLALLKDKFIQNVFEVSVINSFKTPLHVNEEEKEEKNTPPVSTTEPGDDYFDQVD